MTAPTRYVRIELPAHPGGKAVTIDGQAHVWIPARVVDLLADHGWYPPAHAVVGGSGVTLSKPPTDGGEPA